MTLRAFVVAVVAAAATPDAGARGQVSGVVADTEGRLIAGGRLSGTGSTPTPMPAVHSHSAIR